MKRNTRTGAVTEHIELDFVDDEGCHAVLAADLVYDSTDPYAMSMVFQTLPPVTWTFSRDLLATGMYEPAGDGDVHIWPCLSADGEAVVIFEFCSPDGEVLVQTGQRGCARFVERMFATVPEGEESGLMDIDAALEQIFGGTPDVSV